MSLRAVGLWALPLLTSVYAIGFPSPAPTASLTRPLPQAPQPTPGINLRQFGILRRQDDYSTTAKQWADSTSEPNLCGWVGAHLGQDSKISCATTATCRYHASNGGFGPLMGCCDNSDVCAFPTACFELDKVSETPALTDTQRAFSVYCTETSAPACVTFFYSDLGVTNVGCGPTSDHFDVYTSAFDDVVVDNVITRWDQYITPIDEQDLSSYTSTFSSTTRSQAAFEATSMVSSSKSPHITESSKPVSSDSGSSSSGSSSTSTGAIAGGVVGGVVGGAAIALAGVFLLRRKKKNNQAQVGADTIDLGGAYQTVPGDHPGHPGVEMQPTEMESNDPSHRMAEAQGDLPAERSSTVLGGVKPEMETDQKMESEPKDIVAELPADHNPGPRP